MQLDAAAAHDAFAELGGALGPVGRGRGAGGRPDRRREHGERDPPDRGRARPRPARLRAHRVRRRRPAPRAAPSPSGSDDDGPRAAASRALLGVRRGDRASRGSTACGRCYARSDRLDVEALARSRADVARGARSTSCAQRRGRRSRLLDRSGRHALRRVRTTSSRCRCRTATSTTGDWEELLRRLRGASTSGSTASRCRASRSSSINLRVTALSPEQPPAFALSPAARAGRPRTRPVWFDAAGPSRCADRPARVARCRAPSSPGPRVIEEPDSTTLVHPGDTVRVDGSGVLVLSIGRLGVKSTLELDSGRPARPAQRAREHRGRDGARDDEDVVLDDLQRGPRLLDRAARPRRQPDRREELHAVDDGRDHRTRCGGRSRSSAPDFFEPGDVVVHNDPYRGNCHMPEHMMMKPIFREGRADRVRRQHRAHRGGRRQGARQLRRPTRPTSTRRACACRR